MGKVHATQMENYLLSFCAEQQMTVSNTLFQMPDKWFYSWQHPRSKRYHLLDYVLVRQSNTQDITSTRIMRGADCSTGHFLVRTICKFHVKPIRRRTKASITKRVSVRSLVDDYEVQTKFQEAPASKLNSLDQSSETSINEQWQSISAATHEVMLKNLEPPPRRNADWFDEKNESIQSLLQERTAARNEMLNTGLRSKAAKFKECKRKVQSSLRRMKDDWWNKKAEAVQDLAESVYGPRHLVTSPFYNKPGTVLLTTRPLSYKRHVTVTLASPYGKPVISKPFGRSKTGG